MGPLGHIWANLDDLKKENEGVTDLDLLVKLFGQCLIIVGEYHSRGLYFR